MLQRELNDPRIGFVTVLRVEPTEDIREAKVYYSVLGDSAVKSRTCAAIEAAAGYRNVLHGEAVAMGMAHAARRSERLGLAPEGSARRLEALLRRFGLPTELPPLPRSAYIEALRVDKKRRGTRIHYIVLRGIGRATAVPLTPAQILPPSPPRRRGRAAG